MHFSIKPIALAATLIVGATADFYAMLGRPK